MEKLPHILLVDDDETTNFLNEHLLTKLQVSEQVRVATSGEEALALLTQPPPYQPTLLLLDIAMPGMGGIAFLEAYLRLPPAQQDATVILVLTTSMDSRDLERLHELPIAGLVSKPLNRERIDTLLQLHFQRHLPHDE
ncbi:response regulator [Hymenobacter wooponensis]|uniref:Response regulator n=1 Tax=Hymenobacter wooponensis TaxID=1525360 RepID=A0A4Z0MC28_9BACT|nr:response regulator [Hymenobacter wooponensis]TGD76805.1 response regulator [Hymenobacter wooponensis]